MFEDLGVEESKYLDHWLAIDNFLSLQLIHGSVMRFSGKKFEDFKNSELRSHTLSYLQKLLEEGKLKVGRQKLFNSAAEIPAADQVKGVSMVKDIANSPREIVKIIRQEWNSKQPNELGMYEINEILFTLPENKWPEI